MNLKFLELPDEKQRKIINAGFEVFAKSEYKRAATEEIAEKAGISKGILFYYFHDKETFYTFLFEKAVSKMKEFVIDDHMGEIKDFFELCAYAAERKYRLLSENPYITDFIMRAFYAKRDSLPDNINSMFQEETENIFGTYFRNVDFSRFRGDTDPKEIYHMLIWLAEGYLQECQRSGKNAGLDEIMKKFRQWTAYFRRISYKEEYLQ